MNGSSQVAGRQSWIGLCRINHRAGNERRYIATCRTKLPDKGGDPFGQGFGELPIPGCRSGSHHIGDGCGRWHRFLGNLHYMRILEVLCATAFFIQKVVRIASSGCLAVIDILDERDRGHSLVHIRAEWGDGLQGTRTKIISMHCTRRIFFVLEEGSECIVSVSDVGSSRISCLFNTGIYVHIHGGEGTRVN